MGFFDKLAEAFNGFVADAETALGKITTQASFAAVVQASYLIAGADGSVDDSEKAALQKLIASKFPHFGTTDIVREIKHCDSECEFSVLGGQQMLLNSIGKQAATDTAPLVMVAVLAVANADGVFDDSEKAMARQIAARLGLNAKDYGL